MLAVVVWMGAWGLASESGVPWRIRVCPLAQVKSGPK